MRKLTTLGARALWVSSCLFVVACGGAAVPQEKLTSAQAAIKGAEVAGASEDPKAALYLKLSREGVDKANALITESENEHAARVLDRALADAELALALANEARTKQAANQAKEQAEELKQRIEK
ncbi:MAG: DUF4398 domain-containing protein [Polyangiaceae bacterium]